MGIANDVLLCPEVLVKEIGLLPNKHYQRTDNKFIIKKCFYCPSEDSTFQIDATSGSWKCTSCGNFGNYESLKAFVHDEYGFKDIIPTSSNQEAQQRESAHQSIPFNEYEKTCISSLLQPDNPAFIWLTQTKKLTESTIKYFHLGYTIIDNRDFITIPYFDTKNNIVCLKYRWASDEKSVYRSFISPTINKPSLYNYNNLSKDGKEIFITKNEMDCWALHQMGWKDVIAIPQTEINSYKYLEPLKDRKCRINLMFPSKYADKMFVNDTIDYLGKDHTYHIKLLQEIFQMFTNSAEEAKEAIEIAINQAEDSTLVDLITIDTAFSEVLLDLAQPKSGINLSEGVNSPWESLNKHIPIFRYGNLIVVAGHSGHGKTSCALDWARYLTKELSLPTLFLCLEMNKAEHVYKLTELMLGEHQLGNIDYTLQAHGILHQQGKEVPLIIARKIRNLEAPNLLELFDKTILKFNLKAIFFDHFQFVKFARQDRRYRSDASLYSEFANDLKNFSDKTGIIFFCLSQFQKLDERIIPTKQHIRETGELEKAANEVIILHRRRIEPDLDEMDVMESMNLYSKYTLTILDKVRMGGKPCMFFLKYDNGRLVDPKDEDIEEIIEEKKALFTRKRFVR